MTAPKVETIKEAQWRKQVERWRDQQHQIYSDIPVDELREILDWHHVVAVIARGGLETTRRLSNMLAVALIVLERTDALDKLEEADS